MSETGGQAPGWYHAQGDPPGTQRYWDGRGWVGGPEPAGPPSAGPIPSDRDHLPELGRTLASPGQRILARLIDAIIYMAVATVVLFAFGTDSVEGGTVSPGYFLVLALFGLVYEVGMVATRGGTLGKLAMGIGVVTQDGAFPPGVQPAFRRWIPTLAGYLPVIGFLAGLAVIVASLIWLFSDARRRSVYDRVGRTYVVRTRA